MTDRQLPEDSNPYSVQELFRHLQQSSSSKSISSDSFGKYKIQRFISSRRNSAILLAYDPDLRRQVVLKIYKPDLSQDQKTLILNEGQALAQIDNEHVAKCLAVESLEDCPFLVLEYISGTALDKLNVPLPEEKALEILRQLSIACSAVHDRGLLHLDLKPSNVLLTEEGTVKLIDFGLAQPMSNVRFGEVSGTPSFMAPEVANHEVAKIERRSDIFGLGSILYFLLSGNPPFAGDSIEEVVKHAQLGIVKPIQQVSPGVSLSTAKVCDRCLSKKVSERYRDVESLIGAINESNSSSKRRLWLATSILLLAALLAYSFFWKKPSPSLQAAEVLAQLTQVDSDLLEPAQDFKLSVVNDEFQNGIANFQDQETVHFEILSSVDGFVAVYSVQYGDLQNPTEHPDKIVFVRGIGNPKIQAGKPFAAKTRVGVSPENKTEYFVIVVRDSEWNPAETMQLASELARTTSTEPNPQKQRGVDRDAQPDLESILILPYRVASN